jgi:hypothetical protein
VKFENVLGLGGLAVLVGVGAGFYRIADKLDERHIDSVIRAGAVMITVIVLGVAAMIFILSYLRRRDSERQAGLGPAARQRGSAYYQPMLPPSYGYPPALPAEQDNQGSFVARGQDYAAPTQQEDWR